MIPLLASRKIIYGLFAVAAVIAFFLHYRGLINDLKTAEANVAVLSQALDTEKKAFQAAVANIKEWEQTSQKFQQDLEWERRGRLESKKELRRLNDVFAKHDLGKLALQKPDAVRDRVNSGTRDMLRLFERATGDSGHGDNGIAEAGEAKPATP